MFFLSPKPRFPRSLFALLYAAVLYAVSRLFLVTVRSRKKKIRKKDPSSLLSAVRIGIKILKTLRK